MSTHVVGFRPPDENWKKMKAVWDACVAACVDVPESVLAYFNWTAPSTRGVEVDLSDERLGCVSPWQSDGRSGFEVNVPKLPSDVTVIRFWNSW